MGVSIQHLPWHERPRERCRSHGVQALTDGELLALVLGSGAEGRSVLEVSREVLGLCRGSLREVAKRPISYLMQVRGVGPVRAAVVHAALELGRRMAEEGIRADGIQLFEARRIAAYFASSMANLPVEELRVAVLDAQCRVVSESVVARGVLNAVLIHAREVFRQAICENAFAIVLAHNHPSGDPGPSDEDRRMMEILGRAGELVGIWVLDHVIIGEGCYYSWRQQAIFQ